MIAALANGHAALDRRHRTGPFWSNRAQRRAAFMERGSEKSAAGRARRQARRRVLGLVPPPAMAIPKGRA